MLGIQPFFHKRLFRDTMTIYVGNLPFSATEEEVQELFSQYGTVLSVKLISDRDTGRPRGFGFVEMDRADAEEAIDALDGYAFNGRNLQVNEAREKKERSGGGGGGGGRGGYSDRSRGGRSGERRY